MEEPRTDVRTLLGTAFDTVALRATQLVVDTTLMPGPDDLPRLRESAAPYVAEELRREPRRFFDFLDAPPRFAMTERGRGERAGGVVVTREFASDYAPYVCPEPDGRCRESATITVEHWTHGLARPVPTVVALHGFLMGNPRLGALSLLGPSWFERGLDVVLLKLPLHRLIIGRRLKLSAYGLPAADVGNINEAVRQAVYEARLVIAWLRAETGGPVGLLGVSLGGYVAALLAGLLDGLDFVIPMSAPVCIGDLAWRFFERSRRYRAPAAAPPSREELRDFYRVHSPLTHPLRVPRERVLIIAGRGDRIVPPEHPRMLRRHWGEPETCWLGGSHLVPLDRARVVAAVERHFRGIGIA